RLPPTITAAPSGSELIATRALTSAAGGFSTGGGGAATGFSTGGGGRGTGFSTGGGAGFGGTTALFWTTGCARCTAHRTPSTTPRRRGGAPTPGAGGVRLRPLAPSSDGALPVAGVGDGDSSTSTTRFEPVSAVAVR